MGNDCIHDNKHATMTGFEKGLPKWKISSFCKYVQKHENLKIDILIFWLKQHFETLWNDCIDLIKDITCCYEVYNLEIPYFHKIAYSMQYIQNTKYDFIKYNLLKTKSYIGI